MLVVSFFGGAAPGSIAAGLKFNVACNFPMFPFFETGEGAGGSSAFGGVGFGEGWVVMGGFVGEGLPPPNAESGSNAGFVLGISTFFLGHW